MNFLVAIFNTILYQPLLNILILLYQYLPGQDFGLAIIVLTLLIRSLLHPLVVRSLKSQRTLMGLQPKIQEIQKKYNGDRTKQGQAIIALYQKEKVNPFSGFFLLLIQLPILIALFQVFGQGLQPEALGLLYPFVPRPESIDPTFFDFINLAKPYFGIAILAGIFQFFQSKMMNQSKINQRASQIKADLSQVIQRQTIYFLPLFTVFILTNLPAAIGLYWLVTSLFSILEQYLVFGKTNPAA